MLDHECSSSSNINEKTIILLDDEAATGAHNYSCCQMREKKGTRPKYLIIGIPVAPKDTLQRLKAECDAVEVITSPSSMLL